MPRHLRVTLPGLVHHVTNRGNGRMDIFLDDTDRRRFLQLLTDAAERFEFECWNYCLMSNHYHLLAFMRGPRLSDALQFLNGTYGKWWNARHERVGHVFQGRFKDQIVQLDEGPYLRNVCRYISLNPVRAGLVRRATEWQWSGHRALIGVARKPTYLRVDGVLAGFGGDEQAPERFGAFVDGTVPAWDEVLDDIRSTAGCLGDAAFKRRLAILHDREIDVATTST